MYLLLKFAFDLVGPLPRSQSGYKYLLTSICLASKHPDVVPLRRVDVESVAEGRGIMVVAIPLVVAATRFCPSYVQNELF